MLGASHDGGGPLKAGILLVTLAGLVACGGAEVEPPDVDAGAGADASVGDASTPLDAAAPTLVEGAAIPAVQIPLGRAEGPVVVMREGLIARRGSDAWWIGTATTARIGPVGRITGGVDLGDGSALVLAEDGPRIWTGTALVASPIADALGGARPRRVARTRNNALWFATEDALHLFSEGNGRRVTPGGLPTTDAQLAFGAPVGGQPKLWVAASGQVYALDAMNATLEHGAPARVQAIAIDDGGALWARADGRLFVREPSGRWIDQQRPIDAVGAAWIARLDGVARIRGTTVESIDGLPPDAELVATRGGGRAIVRVAGALIELVPGVRAAILGVEEGAVLTASTAVVAYGTDVRLELDGQPVRGGSAFRGGLRAVIPAGTLAEGPHALVAYSGTDEARVAFTSLQGGVPTWTRDVEPFFRERCASCHGAGGNAHDLDGLALWRLEIDRILAAVRERRMPLPPYRALEADEIARIDGWKSAGFPE